MSIHRHIVLPAVLMLFLLSCAVAPASDWRPSEPFMDALRQIESSGGRFLVGDRGKSLGEYQMGVLAWTDVNTVRKRRGQTALPYRSSVFDPQISRAYAADYLGILRNRLKPNLKREPSPAELYAAYNMGFTNFRKCGFNLQRVNSVTARKCQQITVLIETMSNNSAVAIR